MSFEVVAADGRARAATLVTAHGAVDTPIFMPVGTRGTVRTQTAAQLATLAPPIILANTHHLRVRPGPELFARAGGLHRWMRWDRAILTDSGGYQMYSLGEPELLTPEQSIAMQRALGSDIMMVLDRCIPATAPHAHAREAVEVTRQWAARSKAARGDSSQALFGIVQGACYPDLRRTSAAQIVELGFDGYAIGGLAVGESKAQREDITELTAALLPADRPRYLMGVGTPLDVLEAVARGVDMMDCILPTAVAQHGVAFTSHGRLDLRRGVHRLAEQPLDGACRCEACTSYSRSYLHHLVKCGEPLAWQLLAHHNLAFYLALVRAMRAHIVAGTFEAFYRTQQVALAESDRDNPPGPRPKVRRTTPTARGQFELVTGEPARIRHVPSGEIMHSVNDPDDEAHRIYVAQSVAIADALAGARPIVVWDVGLGAAHNAMALVRALDAHAGHAPVTLVSFEHDLDALQLALAHTKHFPHVRHAAPHVLAHRGAFARDRFRWELHAGDFRTTFRAAAQPDVIFYDPFSAKTDAPLWSLAMFEALFAFLAQPVELFTYSASTAVRSSLLAAGFHVARGAATGPKTETTIALSRLVPAFARHALLGHSWLARRARSSAPFAADVPPERHRELDLAIRAHAQFRSANPAAE